jgi:hypothetical protein
MIADHILVKKSFGSMIADHDLVKKKFSSPKTGAVFSLSRFYRAQRPPLSE